MSLFIRRSTLAGTFIGIVLGAFYSIGGALMDALVSVGALTSSGTSGLGLGTILAFGALIVMPMVGMTAGFLISFAAIGFYKYIIR